MFSLFVRVVVLGLLAAAASAAAQLVDLSGRPIDFDLITLVAQTQVEAVVPVVNSFGNADLAALGNAWVNKFHKSVLDGTMTPQTCNADFNAFVTGAAALAPAYEPAIRSAVAKMSVNYATFHSFAMAATWDAMEYGVTQSKLKYDANRLATTRALVVTGIKSGTQAQLQLILNNYLTAEEKQNPGMGKAIAAALEAVMKAAVEKYAREPTVAPATSAPAAATPTTKPTSASSGATTMTESPTVAPAPSIGGGSSALDLSAPVATSAASTPSRNSTITTTTNTTTAPTATETSGASVAAALNVAAGALVLALTSALL